MTLDLALFPRFECAFTYNHYDLLLWQTLGPIAATALMYVCWKYEDNAHKNEGAVKRSEIKTNWTWMALFLTYIVSGFVARSARQLLVNDRWVSGVPKCVDDNLSNAAVRAVLLASS